MYSISSYEYIYIYIPTDINDNIKQQILRMQDTYINFGIYCHL